MKTSALITALCLAAAFTGETRAEDAFSTTAMYIAGSGAPKEMNFKYWWESPEAVKTAVERLDKAGIKEALPCVYSHGALFFKTTHAVYKKSVMPDKLGFDPLALMIEEAHKRGIKVVPFFPSLAGAGSEKGLKQLSEGGVIPHMDWFNMDMSGNLKSGESLSYDPANPEFRAHFASLVKDLLKYDIDGLQLDYIRYTGPQWGYTKMAREGFKKETGVDPLDLYICPEKLDGVTLHCLKPRAWKSADWNLSDMLGVVEKTGANFKIVEETEDGRLPELPPKSILLIYAGHSLNDAEAAQLDAMMENGGDVVFIDTPKPAMDSSENTLAKMIGMSGAQHKFVDNKKCDIKPAADAAQICGGEQTEVVCAGNSLLRKGLTTGLELASLDEERPAIVLNRYKNGKAILFNYRMRASGGYDDWRHLKKTIDWLSAGKSLSVSFHLPADAAKRYPWVPAITRGFFDNAGIAPAQSTDTESLRRLAALEKPQIGKTALLFTAYVDPGKEAMALVAAYVRKGGNLLLFMDWDANVKEMGGGREFIERHPELFGALPLGKTLAYDTNRDGSGHGYSLLKLKASQEPPAKGLPDERGDFYGAPFAGTGDEGVAVKMENSNPALFRFKSGEGSIWLFNYGMQSAGSAPGALMRNVLQAIAKDNAVEFRTGRIASLLAKWTEWRCAQVSEVVKLTRDTMRKEKPGIPLSVAVVDSFQPERTVFQNWKAWLGKDYVDGVYSMSYFDDDANLARMLDWLKEGVEPSKASRICPLIKIYALEGRKVTSVKAEKMRGQMILLKERGYTCAGFFADCYIDEAISTELKKWSRP